MVVWGDVRWWAERLEQEVTALAGIVAPNGGLPQWAERAAAAAAAAHGELAVVEVVGVIERTQIGRLEEGTVAWQPINRASLEHADYAVAAAVGWASPDEGPMAIVHPVTLPMPLPLSPLGLKLAETLARGAARDLAARWIEA